MWKRLIENLTLAAVGGTVYYCLELLARGWSHPSMFLVGGVCFWLVGNVNEVLPWDVPLWLQAAAGAVCITVVEFVSGCVLNLWLGLGVWSYADKPFNLLGQVCLSMSLLWVVLSVPAILLDDWLRWQMWGEERPRYRLV